MTRGKPDPEVFLIAAKRLGVPPAHCSDRGRPAGHRRGQCSRHDERRPGEHRPKAGGIFAAARLVVKSLDTLSPQVLREVIASLQPSTRNDKEAVS